MTDTLTLIASICANLNANGFCSGPRVVDPADFDLSGFEKQESDIPGLDFEYVNQSGPGIGGDDYHGTMAYPIEGKLFVIDYHC
jgi:hypothetical protein